MLCHAAPLARQPLSTYGWQQSRPAVLEWLEQSIQYAVQKLDKAPFLELVHSDKQDTHCSIYPVAEAVVDSPQVSYCAVVPLSEHGMLPQFVISDTAYLQTLHHKSRLSCCMQISVLLGLPAALAWHSRALEQQQARDSHTTSSVAPSRRRA